MPANFGTLLKVEFFSLLFVIVLTIIPVNVNYLYLWDHKDIYVDVYFILSIFIILTSNILLFFILIKDREINLKFYFIGLTVFILSLIPWLTRSSENVLNFDQLESSGILSCVVFAAVIVTIQAFWNVTAFAIKK